MKYLFVCVSFALFAYISAGPLYGASAYNAAPLYRVPVYNAAPNVVPLRSIAAVSRVAATASAASAAESPSLYQQYAIPAYELDTSYHGSDYNAAVPAYNSVRY